MLCCCYCEQWYLYLFEGKSQSERLLDGLDSSSRGRLEDSKLTSRFWSNCRTGMLPAFYQTMLLSDGKILSLVNAASLKKLFLLSFSWQVNESHSSTRTLFFLLTAVIFQVQQTYQHAVSFFCPLLLQWFEPTLPLRHPTVGDLSRTLLNSQKGTPAANPRKQKRKNEKE